MFEANKAVALGVFVFDYFGGLILLVKSSILTLNFLIALLVSFLSYYYIFSSTSTSGYCFFNLVWISSWFFIPISEFSLFGSIFYVTIPYFWSAVESTDGYTYFGISSNTIYSCGFSFA